MKQIVSLIVALLVVLLAAAAIATADVPGMINYQGRLTDDTGSPVDDTLSMTFTIYDDSTNGGIIWTEDHSSVIVNAGLFSVILGTTVPINNSVFADTARWLQITVEGEDIIPRTRLVTAPYSFRTATVDGATGGIISGDVDIQSDFTVSGKATIGPSHTNTGNYAFVAGGNNTVSGDWATVSGGQQNEASEGYSTVGGGFSNKALEYYATVSGGLNNEANGSYSIVCGGWGNRANTMWSTVVGGTSNTANYSHSYVGGGGGNTAFGSHSVVCGGDSNFVGGSRSAIVGGYADTISFAASYSYLFGIKSKLTQDSTFMVDMPHVRFGDEATGYEFPSSDGLSGQVMATDGSGQLSWTDVSGGGGGWVDDGAVVRLETSTDDVGIGTPTPSEKLDVDGNIHASGTLTSGSSITIDGNNDEITASSGKISLGYDTLVTLGSIVVSNTLPSAGEPLYLARTFNTTENAKGIFTIVANNNSGWLTGGNIQAYGSDGIVEGLYAVGISDGSYRSGVIGYAKAQDGSITTGNSYGVQGRAEDGAMAFGVKGEASSATIGYGVYGYAHDNETNWAGYFSGDVNVTGNVGIGTPTPSEKLDVDGNIHASGTLTSGGSITIDGANRTITSTNDSIFLDDQNVVIRVTGGRSERSGMSGDKQGGPGISVIDEGDVYHSNLGADGLSVQVGDADRTWVGGNGISIILGEADRTWVDANGIVMTDAVSGDSGEVRASSAFWWDATANEWSKIDGSEIVAYDENTLERSQMSPGLFLVQDMNTNSGVALGPPGQVFRFWVGSSLLMSADATATSGRITIRDSAAAGDSVKYGPPDTVFRQFKSGTLIMSADATATSGRITIRDSAAAGDSVKYGPPDTVFRQFKSGTQRIFCGMSGAEGMLTLYNSSGSAMMKIAQTGIELDPGQTFDVTSHAGTNIYSDSLETSGVTLASGGGSWSSICDRNKKENFVTVDNLELLEKLASLPVSTWNYKTQDPSIRHIGPMAQDFYSAFGLGEDNLHISTVDADGVALAAIQALYEKTVELEEKSKEINTLKAELKETKAQLSQLSDLVQTILAKQNESNSGDEKMAINQ